MKELLNILPDRQLSLSEFVIKIDSTNLSTALGYKPGELDKYMSFAFGLTVRYNKFLQQPLELRMLVPCDEEGNVLEEPINYNYDLEFIANDFPRDDNTISDKTSLEYQKAKERCLYKNGSIEDGFVYSDGVIVDALERFGRNPIESMCNAPVQHQYWIEALKLI